MDVMNWNILASSSYGAANRLARERYDRSAVAGPIMPRIPEPYMHWSYVIVA